MPAKEIELSNQTILSDETVEREINKTIQNLSLLAHKLYFDSNISNIDRVIYTDTIADATKLICWLYNKSFNNKENENA